MALTHDGRKVEGGGPVMHKWRMTAEKMQNSKELEDDRGNTYLTTRGRSARPAGTSRGERPNSRGN
jgi:hypothetical protein